MSLSAARSPLVKQWRETTIPQRQLADMRPRLQRLLDRARRGGRVLRHLLSLVCFSLLIAGVWAGSSLTFPTESAVMLCPARGRALTTSCAY
jgi:hypothetical protein